ncbi:MAG: hypothetical protein ACJAT2_001124 [Bacteriovoracaceae bacterium]|jgi:hypothetical protein
MNSLLKFAIAFLALTGATTLLMTYTEVPFLEENYWENHGVFFLIFITLFPRLTLLFSSVPFGGLLWWLGFIFAPRILVATLATITYWEVNPILVVISWLVAISGESGEKSVLNTQVRVVRTGGSRRHTDLKSDDIEVDYREIK